MHVKEYLKEKNITIKQLARELGYAYNHVCMCVNGKLPISLTMARQISHFTNNEVRVEELIEKKTKEKCPTCGRIMLKKH